MRSALYVAWLAWRRLRRRESGALVAALGLTAATAVLAGVFAGVTIAADRSTAGRSSSIPAAGRSVRAVWFGMPAGADETLRDALDATCPCALDGLSLAGPDAARALPREHRRRPLRRDRRRSKASREHVVLRSGRLPRECTPERCEVLRLRGARRAARRAGSAPRRGRHRDARLAPALRRLPRADRQRDARTPRRRPPARVGPLPPPGRAAARRGGGDRRARLVARARAPVPQLRVGVAARPGEPAQVGDRRARRRLERARAAARARLERVLRGRARRGAARGRAHGRRSAAAGCSSSAARLLRSCSRSRCSRREACGATSRAAHARLTWYGARRWQLALLTGVESGLVGARRRRCSAGSSGAWPVRSRPRRAGAPAWRGAAREHALRAAGSLLALAAALAAGGARLARRLGARAGRARVGAPEALAARGAARRRRRAARRGARRGAARARRRSSVVLLLLFPGLLALAAAVVVARLFPVLARARSRTARAAPVRPARRARPRARLRRPPPSPSAFLTIAFALALLAEGYRATLVRGEREQAAFQVPLDVVVREDPGSLVRVFEAAPLERYRELAGEGGERVSGAPGRGERGARPSA